MRDEGADLPNSIKIVMVFINRVGFPIVAFLLMVFLTYKSIKDMSDNMVVLTDKVIQSTAQSSIEHTKIMNVLDDHDPRRRR